MWFEQELEIEKKVGSKEKEAVYKLMRIAPFIGKKADKFFSDYGLTESQYKILELIHQSDKKGMTQVKISESLLVNRSNITGLIDRLEKGGFVVRSTAPKDRRINLIKLKEKAKKILAAVQAPYDEMISSIMKPLNRDEVKTFEYLLNKIEKHSEISQEKR